jgi:signal transduction histidine kinase
MSLENIFESRLTLRLIDKVYEKAYQYHRYQKLRKYNIILSTILFTLTLILASGILVSLDKLWQTFTCRYTSIIEFTVTFLLGINLILSVVIKNPNIQSWITYINYIYILFVFSTFRFFFVYVLQVDMLIYTFLFTVEIFFRLAWFFLGIIDFVPGVYLHLITIIVNYGTFYVAIPMNLHFRFSVSASIFMFTCGITYFLIKEQKRSFYYYLSMKSKYDWFKNVIDNMNSGFMSIENKEIKYYNRVVLKLFNESGGDDSCSIPSILSLDDIFKNIQCELHNIINFNDAIQVLAKNYTLAGDNFFFIGTKYIETSPTTAISLEVYGRCYSSHHSVIDKYEFIFNDITRSKLIEEKNAEFKYKNLFLSKVAHEFKNPLLCICELVDQIIEETNTTDLKITDILKQIKSMSNYLIILVKDLDFFSQKNTGIIKTIENDHVNLQDLLKFCKDIISGLIKKLHKDNYIKFEMIKDENLPRYIYSDEIKLKQVLVNLLSNSTKYTHSGSIKLKVTQQGDNVKFTIEDTGKGISEQQKEKVFIPFSNEFDKLNKVSSGLGLSIVKDLTDLLGSKIEFQSVLGKGSSFWFEIPIIDQMNSSRVSRTSIMTIKGIHYSERNVAQFMQLDTENTRLQTRTSVMNKELTIIVVDDEIITRQSTVRLLSKQLKEKSYDVTIVEASDGIECLYKYQLLYKEGKKIDFILSDETMDFINGSMSAEILRNMYFTKGLVPIPFFILSAYETLSYGDLMGINLSFSKPLKKQNIDEILKKI